MMSHRTTCLTAAVCCLFLAVGAGAKEDRTPDAWITAKVKSTLAARKNVSAFGTKVETKNGIVVLRGEVKSEAEKELAAKYASQIEGVRGVDNHLIVRDAEREEGDRAGDDRTGDDRRGPGDRALDSIGNAGLTGRVKAALAAAPATSAFRTNVDTRSGKVTLRGTAKSDAERDLAEEVARGVEGVRDVDNKIRVEN